jgi:ribosomal protein S18 acetylase RimI-like enzyme
MTDALTQTRRMQALVSELWRLEGPNVDHHVGDLAWGRFQHSGREGEWRIRLWEEDGEVVAWAWLRLPGTLAHEIHPRHRGGRLHEELFDWFESEAEGDELRASSLTTDPERLTFLHARGCEIDAESDDTIYHLTELGSVPEPALPDGYRLRTVGPADLEQRVEIHRAVWAPSRVTLESFANVQAAWPYRRDLDCVVEAPDGSFAAYCLAWLDDANGVGEFEPVGTHPDHQRRGLATAVCRFALLRLREEGATRAIVYSVEGFGGGTALYESLGMHEHARSVALVKRR